MLQSVSEPMGRPAPEAPGFCCAEHNTDMLIYAAVQSGQYRVARTWAAKIRSHQEELHTAAYGDGSRSWTHLPLVYVRPKP